MDPLPLATERWLHVTSGIAWVGLLYYFNFIQVPAPFISCSDTAPPK